MQIGLNYNTYIYPNKNFYQRPFSVQKQSSAVSFGNRSFLSLPKEKIFDRIDKSINEKNFLGEGSEASVYKIVDSDYCIRLNSDFRSDYRKHLSFDISEEDKINHIVAKLGDDATILKYIEGIPVFAKEEDVGTSSIIKESVKSAPISSFQKLLAQIAYAANKDMIFDCCGANVIINPKTKEITAIDFYKNTPEFTEVVRPLSAIYSALVTSFDDVEYRKVCANKVLNAGIQEISKPNEICLPIGNFDFSRLLYNLKLEGLFPNDKYYNLLKNICADIQKLKLEELRGKNVATELYGRIKMAKALVKQLF